jgi:hypothetical protein
MEQGMLVGTLVQGTTIELDATKGQSGRIRTYGERRGCSHPGCATRLSIYNASSCCYAHLLARRSEVRGGSTRTGRGPLRKDVAS